MAHYLEKLYPYLIQNPGSIERSAIEAKLMAHKAVLIQFDKPYYKPELLQKLNQLCGEFGSAVKVQFYAHYGHIFDGSIFDHLPDVTNLSIESVSEAKELSALGRLENLRSFRLFVHNLTEVDLLNSINLKKLEELSLGESLRTNLDLSPLVKCGHLKTLHLEKRAKGIETLAVLPQLHELTLRSIPKTQKLGFVSKIKSLKHLQIILGGRENISEISHPSLENLEIIWVKGFNDLGSTQSLPALRSLHVEKQIQLEHVRFFAANAKIQSLKIIDCKKLEVIDGLNHLIGLKSLTIGTTAVKMDSILEQPLASSLKIFKFWTSKSKENRIIRQKLDALGYQEQ